MPTPKQVSPAAEAVVYGFFFAAGTLLFNAMVSLFRDEDEDD